MVTSERLPFHNKSTIGKGPGCLFSMQEALISIYCCWREAGARLPFGPAAQITSAGLGSSAATGNQSSHY